MSRRADLWDGVGRNAEGVELDADNFGDDVDREDDADFRNPEPEIRSLMFIFGHLGVGRTLLLRWRHRFHWAALGFGMLLPDLIDKPLYYLELSPFFSCTRTVGHTGLLLALVCLAAAARRSAVLWAIGIGMATHVGLDNVLEQLGWHRDGSAWIALTWPLHGWDFYRVTFTMVEHAGKLLALPTVIGEAVGLTLIGLELWGRRGRVRS
jgi:hypothetical protein